LGFPLPEDIIHGLDDQTDYDNPDKTAKAFEEIDNALAREAERVAKTFPSLRKAPGISPFNPFVLDEWTNGPTASKSAYQSVSFLLDHYLRSQVTRARCQTADFNVFEAMREWSDEDRDAFRNVWRGRYPDTDEYDQGTGQLIKGRSQTREWREGVKEMRENLRRKFEKMSDT